MFVACACDELAHRLIHLPAKYQQFMINKGILQSLKALLSKEVVQFEVIKTIAYFINGRGTSFDVV